VQVADIVMTAVTRIAAEGDGYVTLGRVQADRDVQRHVMSSSRVTDIMGELEGYGLVRMVARHPVPTWRVVSQ
jgi:hypothetical protein